MFFLCNIASLVGCVCFPSSLRSLGVWCFLFLLRSFLSSRAEQSVEKDLGSIAQPINGLLVVPFCHPAHTSIKESKEVFDERSE